MSEITVTIPSHWIEGLDLDQEALRQVLRWGLEQWRKQRAAQVSAEQIMQALLSTGRIRRLMAASESMAPDTAETRERQTPPRLPGSPVSEILIAQRGES